MTIDQQRAAVVAEALSWLGTPYHHLAQVKGAGVDCGQLLLAVYRDAGLIPQTESGYYPSDWHFHRDDERYLEMVKRFAHEVEVPKPGDIAVFKFARCVSHGVIILDFPRVIHAQLGQGCVLADINDAELLGRCVGFYSLWGS